jgi:long-chain acyl-CoA synthetase
VGKLDKPVWDRLKSAVPTNLKQIALSFHGADGDFSRDDFEYRLMDLVEANEPFAESPVPDDEDVWTMVYTSGTTGYPKGAVHCYRAPRFVGSRAIESFELTENERGLSFLPLAHVAERLLVGTASVYCNGQINFIQSLNTFQRDLCDVQPTLFFSVPRLWKKFQGGILEKMPQEKLDTLLRIPILRKIVAKKLRAKLGLAEARMVISGAAPISPALLQWYKKVGVEILEGYGMTENFAYGCIGRPGANKMGTVGLPMEGCGFKMSEEGEILFKSPTLMKEYYKAPDKTAEALTEDGYYRTGDLGTVDAQGFVSISGRSKEIFKTEKGEYVAPSPIENKVASFKDFEQICLGGIGLAQPILVVTLTEQGQAKAQAELNSSIEAHIKDLNKQLLNHEKIGGVVVAAEDWLPETGMVTPTLKIKRNKVEERYADMMLNITQSGDSVLWEAAA